MVVGSNSRVYAGERARDLRDRQGLRQSAMAAKLGISISYLSQIESNDRPITASVLAAYAREFPGAWGELAPDSDATLLAQAMVSVDDRTIPAGAIDGEMLKSAVKRYPQLVGRLVATHSAYQRTQEQLRAFDDRLMADIGDSAQLPWEEVRDWFHAERNYVDALDRAAEKFEATLPAGISPRGKLEDALAQGFGVQIASFGGGQTLVHAYDPESRLLYVDPAQSPESTLFTLARQTAKLAFSDLLVDISGASRCSDAARALLSAGLENYAAGALLMPYRRFRTAAAQFRHDIDQIRLVFGTSFEQTCHRLSTLQRPGACGTPVFFCRVDMAGNITKRHSATRLQFAQSGGACPLWIVHEAVAIPDRVLVQLAETPDGARYVSMAKGLVKPSSSFARPPRRYAVAVGCEVNHASAFVYADGLQLSGVATPIGNSCRVCLRADCEQRSYPPAGAKLRINPDSRGLVPYTFI